jgi:hypothetical protein
MTKQEAIVPCSIESSKADLERARIILLSDKSYVVRYLRQYPTVGLATLPVRNKDGEIITDMDWVRKRVICSGTPFACMIAFKYQDKLLIGWSKRIADRKLVETADLHSLFKGVMDNVSEASDGYDALFAKFTGELVKFLTYQEPKDIEISFSKRGGKTAAIVRGLRDSITIHENNFVKSDASGPVPHEVAKNLRWFVDQAEKAYGGKAANVSYPEFIPAKAENILPATA